MKKLTTTITTINGIKKEISVWLNEETAEKLEKCDVNILHEYILEEYKSRLIERKETRRHQSLNKSLEHGFDVIDKNLDLEDIVFQKIEAERLHKALTELTSEQRQLIEKIYFKEEKQTDIARELGIDKPYPRGHKTDKGKLYPRNIPHQRTG